MEKVRIFKVTCNKAYMMSEQGTGLSLNPWGNDTEYYEGNDDGGTVFDLPDGYILGISQSYELGIFNQLEHYCDLIDKGNRIGIMDHDQNGKIIYLTESDDQDFENPNPDEE